MLDFCMLQVIKSWNNIKDGFGRDHCTCEVKVGDALWELQETKNITAIGQMKTEVQANIEADDFLRGRVHMEGSRLKLRPELIKVRCLLAS
jgi:hypothetical protein